MSRLRAAWTSTSPTTSSRCATAPGSCSTTSPRRRGSGPTPSAATRVRRARSGRRWPSRAGSASRCPKRRAASGWARSRSRCSARSSAATPRPRRSCRRCSRSTRFADGRRGRVGRALARAATRVACVAWDPARAGAVRAVGRRRGRARRRRRVRARARRERPRARSPRWISPASSAGSPFDPAAARRIGGADARDARCSIAARRSRAADLLGSASRALDLAVEYAKDRVQFGRPIGSFQAVKHRCADMLVDVEGMRSTVVLGRVVHRRRRSPTRRSRPRPRRRGAPTRRSG